MHLLCLAVLFSMTSGSNAQNFRNPIPTPYLMTGNSFAIDIGSATHNFDPNGFQTDINLNVSLPAYCYNQSGKNGMTYLGPTLIFNKGAELDFNFKNNLPSGINTTVHWHGLNIPAMMDGGPHEIILNGGNWTPDFTLIDNAQTVWYHTHLMDQTTDQVVRGLAGLIIVQDTTDPLEKLLPHSYGVNDFPIVIQDKGFVLDTTTKPPTAIAIQAGGKPGNGPYTLINGVVGGVLRVAPEMIRLRILNGSARKMFNIGLSTQFKNPTTFADMNMIATGGGYIDKPRQVKTTLMSTGDRREFVIDFSVYANGDTVYMSNLPVPADANYGTTPGNALMAFVVDHSLSSADPVTSIPATLLPSYSLAPGPVFKERTKRLMGGSGQSSGHGTMWTIDSIPMDMMMINDTVLVNTKERWTIINETGNAHPFHIHKVQFQIVEYKGMMGTDTTVKTYTYPNLPDELIGYKDVQLIRANATMVFEARFDFFPSPLMAEESYMYHCHILPHEDTSMMHQFVVVDSVDFFTGILSEPDTEQLTVFLNQAKDQLTFNSEFTKPGQLSFYDLNGRLLQQLDITSLGNSAIPLQHLPKGVVIVVFTSEKHRYVQKLNLN